MIIGIKKWAFLRAYSKVQAALVDRVAKLERAAMHCNTCGGRCDGDCEEGDEQFENERIASGQPASAGGAPKRCPHGVPSHLGCWNCTSYPVKVGYIGVVAPPAEPPAPAAGTLSERIRANIPAANGAVLGMKVTGEVLAEMADEVAALEARLAHAERERDEWRPRYEAAAADARTLREAWARAERERDERGRQVEKMAEHVATMRVELDEARDCGQEGEVCKVPPGCQHHWELRARELLRERNEATARERERCAGGCEAMVIGGRAWNHDQQVAAETLIAAAKWIRLGAPAPKCDPDPPREVAPDRTQAGGGGQSDDDADEEAMIHDAARLVRRLQRVHPDDGTGSPTNLGWLARYERWRR